MSDNPMAIHSDNKPPLAVKLRSWKWWVYGDMDSQPLEKPLRMSRKDICVNAVVYLLHCCYPFLATCVNRNPPDFNELKTAEGEVIGAGLNAPQIRMKLESGQRLRLTLPSGYWLSKKPETGELDRA